MSERVRKDPSLRIPYYYSELTIDAAMLIDAVDDDNKNQNDEEMLDDLAKTIAKARSEKVPPLRSRDEMIQFFNEQKTSFLEDRGFSSEDEAIKTRASLAYAAGEKAGKNRVEVYYAKPKELESWLKNLSESDQKRYRQAEECVDPPKWDDIIKILKTEEFDPNAPAGYNHSSHTNDDLYAIYKYYENEKKNVKHSDEVSSALAHHGIKGQKWGVRNGPPYPLSKDVTLAMRKNRYNPHGVPWDEDFDTSVRVVNPAQMHSVKELKRKGEAIAGWLPEEDAIVVNSESGGGGRYNCQSCSAAFELRRRGYDVVSQGMPDGSNVGKIENWFQNGAMKNPNPDIEDDPYWNSKDRGRSGYGELADKACDTMVSTLESQGVGARGIIIVPWSVGDYPYRVNKKERTTFFHAVNYEINKAGTAVIYDAQTARRSNQYGLEGIEEASYYMKERRYRIDIRDLTYMRTDNLELSEGIASVVSNRQKDDTDVFDWRNK